MRTINYIDLFAGAGGLSEGFMRQHFNLIADVEMNGYACETLTQTNLQFKFYK